ncbi:MAG: hypothetical protein AAF810_27455 [Cyanobacteria bacterium P01_D01_bin.36]
MVKKFLRFLAGDNQQQPDQQLSLTQDGQPLAPSSQRLNNAVVYRKFSDAISDAGGSELAYPKAVTAETEELFDCKPRQLYKAVGGKVNDRSTLPLEAQAAYQASEIKAWWRLRQGGEAQDLQTQDEKDRYIVETARRAAKETRDDAPW